MTTTTPSARSNPAIRDADTDAPARTGVIRDTWNVLVRESRPVLRNPFSLIFGLMQPLVFLGLYGPLLGGFSSENPLPWFVPGIIVMVALFTTTTTGANLQLEIQTGSHERTLVAPLSRGALLTGRALKEMIPLIIQAAVIIVTTLPFGFRADPAGAVVGLLILGVSGVGFGALSYALALAVRSADWMFWAVQQAVLFPLMILSGMLLPLEQAPDWMRVIAAVNPLSYIVSAERALFAGDWSDASVWSGAIAAAVTALVGLAVGVRAMRRA